MLFLIGCILDRDGYESARALLVDDDQDGVSEHDGDCDDADPSRFPGAVDSCDGNDNDCDGQVDEDAGITWYADRDGDGFGDDAEPSVACDPGDGWVQLGEDCDDTRASIHPDAVETCDGVDEDCDGAIDDNVDGAPAWYVDADGDGYTVGEDGAVSACEEPAGYSSASAEEDCDDANAGVYPDAPEVCGDGVVNACGGVSECRYSGPTELAEPLLENDLGGGLASDAVVDVDGDDYPDLLVEHGSFTTGYTDAVYVYSGPLNGPRLASAPDTTWAAGNLDVRRVLIGEADTTYLPELVVWTSDYVNGGNFRRVGTEGGDLSTQPIWFQATPTTWISGFAFGQFNGYSWVYLEDMDNEARLVGVNNWQPDGGTLTDYPDYVSLPNGTTAERPLAVCDVDSNGIDDVVVGTATPAVLVFESANVDGVVDQGNADATLTADALVSVDCTLDINGDGNPELVVSDILSDTVFLLSAIPAAGALESSASTVLVSDGGLQGFGFTVDAGDLDDDGIYDLGVAAPLADFADFGGGTAGADGGCAVLFYGPFASGTRSATDPGSAAFCSSHDSSFFGMDVSMSHDLTGDGIDDLVSTAGLETASDGVSQGIVYVIPGLTD